MKIVIAIDSFKGSATSSELNAATKAGVLEALPEANVVSFEIADGGEGTLSTLHAGLGGDWVTVETVDLLERPCEASYLLVGGQAFIESASVVGIDKITPSPETFEKATTKGLAKLFEDAVAQGAQEIYLTLGGTGTSDGGRGLFEALNGKVSEVKLYGISDVTNVYAGPEGYSIFFGKQKGGTSGQIAAQNESALAFAAKMKTERGIDLQKIPGTGAAGGLGGAIALLGGKIVPGFPKIAEILGIESAIADADLVLTGEGRMDFQTANGKVPAGMARLAEKHGVPTIALCGALADDLGEMDKLLLASFSIQRSALPLEEAMEKTRTLENMRRLSRNVVRVFPQK